MKIFCLFCERNEYDSTSNELVAFWFSKPTEEQLSAVIGKDGAKILLVQGYAFYRDMYNTEYRLRDIPEGEVK